MLGVSPLPIVVIVSRTCLLGSCENSGNGLPVLAGAVGSGDKDEALHGAACDGNGDRNSDHSSGSSSSNEDGGMGKGKRRQQRGGGVTVEEHGVVLSARRPVVGVGSSFGGDNIMTIFVTCIFSSRRLDGKQWPVFQMRNNKNGYDRSRSISRQRHQPSSERRNDEPLKFWTKNCRDKSSNLLVISVSSAERRIRQCLKPRAAIVFWLSNWVLLDLISSLWLAREHARVNPRCPRRLKTSYIRCCKDLFTRFCVGHLSTPFLMA